MDEFAAWLEKGPRFARVTDVDAEPVDAFEADTFEIQR
jgi:acylphosphatase